MFKEKSNESHSMSPQKMSYFSDIDLATLHRSRLNERIQYKLSWFNRRQKYYIPPTGNQVCHRDTAAHTIKTYANRKIATAIPKKPPSQTPNNGFSETNASNELHNSGNGNTIDTNRSRKPTIITNSMRNLKHCDKKTENDKKLNNLPKNSVVNNNNMTLTKNQVNQIEKKQSVSSSSVSLASTDPDLLTSNLKHSSVHEMARSGDAINRNARDMSNKTSDTPLTGTETTIDEDLNQPHRKRSGTWPRTRSLNAPSPFQQFGPCGRIMKNSAMVMQIQDPASQRLTWYKPPLAVLVIKKVRDQLVLPPFVQLVEWLIQEKHMVVWVEAAILDDEALLKDKKFQKIKDKLVTFKDGRDDLTDRIDFIVCLGGDGTLLYASLLFQQSVPPVMAFHLGSLGFLTPFQFDNFQEQVTNVLEGHAALTLRSRLRCIIVRKNQEEPSESSCEKNWLAHRAIGNDSANGTSAQKPATNILVLNEVVIDRGPSPYLCNIDLFLDGKHITSVQGDGLIVSTPTGSTAYAVAAGASMIHPSVPAIMVTPICPHSLSFRPIVVPAGVELKISVSLDSRNTSWVSFDGRNRQELLHGDSLRVTTSIYPVPSICAQDQISDWFDSLAECLHWNVRKTQKSLDELSDLTASGSDDALDELEKNFDMNINDS